MAEEIASEERSFIAKYSEQAPAQPADESLNVDDAEVLTTHVGRLNLDDGEAATVYGSQTSSSLVEDDDSEDDSIPGSAFELERKKVKTADVINFLLF